MILLNLGCHRLLWGFLQWSKYSKSHLLIFFIGSSFNLLYVLFPSFTVCFYGGWVDSWCSFLSVIILSGLVDIKFIVVDTNNITLFTQIYHFLEWIWGFEQNRETYVEMTYGITQEQKKLVFPNFHENIRGFHQGRFFLKMGTWNFWQQFTTQWFEHWLWSQSGVTQFTLLWNGVYNSYVKTINSCENERDSVSSVENSGALSKIRHHYWSENSFSLLVVSRTLHTYTTHKTKLWLYGPRYVQIHTILALDSWPLNIEL